MTFKAFGGVTSGWLLKFPPEGFWVIQRTPCNMSRIILLDLLDPFFQNSTKNLAWRVEVSGGNKGTGGNVILFYETLSLHHYTSQTWMLSNAICPAATSFLYPFQNSSVAPMKTAGSFQPPTFKALWTQTGTVPQLCRSLQSCGKCYFSIQWLLGGNGKINASTGPNSDLSPCRQDA